MLGVINNPFLSGAVSDCLGMLLDAAFKGSVILVVAAVAIRLMRRRSAAARHLTWFLAVVGLLLVPVLSVVLPGCQVLPRWIDLNVEAQPVAPVASAPSEDPAQQDTFSEFSGLDFTADSSYAAALDTAAVSADFESKPTEAETLSPAGTFPLSEPAADPVLPERTLHPVWLWVFGAWGVGTLIVLAPLCAGILSLFRVGRKAKPITDDSWLGLIRRLSGELGLRRCVVVLESDQRLMPMTWGIIRPKEL